MVECDKIPRCGLVIACVEQVGPGIIEMKGLLKDGKV